jgi:hypothetical protein
MMARTSRRTMTMIAMTMLPDMVVVVLEGLWRWRERLWGLRRVRWWRFFDCLCERCVFFLGMRLVASSS